MIISTAWLILLLITPARAQYEVEVFADNLMSPLGLAVDAQGNIWVAEQGTGNDDGRISVITPTGEVHPVLEGLRSSLVEGSPESAQHLAVQGETLWIAYGLGSTVPEAYLLRVDLTGFTPGDAPLSLDDAEVIDVGSFALDAGFAETNSYNFTFGPGGDLFIVDASANALIRRDVATGALSVFATFDELANPTPVGPPFIHVVPTSIVYTEGRFLVSAFSGFPFLPGLSKIYEVDVDGTVSVFKDGLTSAVDIAVDPRDGQLVVLEFGRFVLEQEPPGFLPGSGQILKIHNDGSIDTLVTGLNFTSGLTFTEAGTMYVSSLVGQVMRIALPAVAQLEDLAASIDDLVARGLLSALQGRVLGSQLDEALAHLNAGDTESAIGAVEAFINRVSALLRLRTLPEFRGAGPIRRNLLSATQGQRFLEAAQAILASLQEAAAQNGFAKKSAKPEEKMSVSLGLENYPNPFNPATEIRFQLPEATSVRLVVYDVSGRLVTRLVDGTLPAGTHQVGWNGIDLPSGLYFYRLEAGPFSETRSMLLLK